MRTPFVSVHPVLGTPDAGNDHVGPSLCGPESGSCRQPRTLNTAALRLRFTRVRRRWLPASPDTLHTSAVRPPVDPGASELPPCRGASWSCGTPREGCVFADAQAYA